MLADQFQSVESIEENTQLFHRPLPWSLLAWWRERVNENQWVLEVPIICFRKSAKKGLDALWRQDKNKPSAETSISVPYAPDADRSTTGGLKVRSGGGQDSFYVAFSQQSLTESEGDPLSSGLCQSASSYGQSLDGTEVLSGAFNSSSSESDTVTLSYSVILSSGGLPARGTHIAVVQADLYEGAFSDSASRESVAYHDIRIRVTVGKCLDVSVVPSGSSFALVSTSSTLSLGTITAGVSAGADLVVRSNIAYDLRMSGATIDLPAGTRTPVASSAAATYSDPCRYALVVTVPDFSLLPHGESARTRSQSPSPSRAVDPSWIPGARKRGETRRSPRDPPRPIPRPCPCFPPASG